MWNSKLNYQILILNYLKGISTYSEEQQLLQWINESAINEALFMEERNKWESEQSKDADYSMYIDQKWMEFKHRLEQEKKVTNNIKKNEKERSLTIYLRYAAVFVLLIGFSLAYYFVADLNSSKSQQYLIDNEDLSGIENNMLVLSDGTKVEISSKESKVIYNAEGTEIKLDENSSNEEKSVIRNILKESRKDNQMLVPKGRQAQITLSDGSRVWLNAGSKLIYPPVFASDKRVVSVEGEAFFEVTKDIGKPFIVKTNGVDIQVLGTSFNVMTNADQGIVETVLVSGKVQIEKNNNPWYKNEKVMLQPGQYARFEKEKEKIQVKYVDVESYITWKEGWYKLDRLTLSELAKKLESYYDIEIRILDIDTEAMKLTGKLDLKEDISQVLENIAIATAIDYKIESDTISIFKKKVREE